MSLFRNEKIADPQLKFDAASLQSTTATAGSGALPSNPAGFIVIAVNGVNQKIPYYNV